MAPHQRWNPAADTSPADRKRTRRLAVLASSWAPWLLPFVALALLLGLRSSIDRVFRGGREGGGGSAAIGSLFSEQQRGPAGALAKAAAFRQELYKSRIHCTNTCFKSMDGVCDEGRVPNRTSSAQSGGARRRLRSGGRGLLGPEENPQVSELYCDLGTDCGDCGPWVGTVPRGWDAFDGPVSWLRAVHNASVFVRRTTTPRPFLAAITHHAADPDVSAMLWHYGAMEGGITRVVHHVLDGQCEAEEATAGDDGRYGGGRRRRIVVDVGANFGYYSVQAALYGCRVLAFEPVRKFRAFLDWSIHAAGVAERVHVLELALSDAEGPLPLVIPRDGTYWGLASVHGLNVMPKEVLQTLTVNATTLDQWAQWAPPGAQPSDVILLKMDVEGWESAVLRGGSKLLTQAVDNILLEYSPGIFERNNMTDLVPQTALPASLLALVRGGYSLAHMPTFEFSAPWPPRPIKPEEPLPPLEQITEAALKHDLEALEYRRVMEVSPGGCPLPAELKEAFPVWRHCREWTYGVHPKGFRSAFGFNTNVWAARAAAAARGGARQHMVLKGVAALFDEAQDMRIRTSTHRPGVGIGLINCNNIGAGHLQLFRCPCPASAPRECVKEQELLARLVADGKMPFTGIEP